MGENARVGLLVEIPVLVRCLLGSLDPKLRRMTQLSPEDWMSEEAFSAELGVGAEMFFRLADTLVRHAETQWGRKHYFQLIVEADSAEAFFDDHGARYNRTFRPLVELTASARGFAIAGLRVAHLRRRLERYVERLNFSEDELEEMRVSIRRASEFVQEGAVALLGAVLKEAQTRGVQLSGEGFPSSRYESQPVQRVLPHNVDHQDLEDEEQKIAEVASKFLQSCEMLEELGIQRLEDPVRRDRFLNRICTEEQARVYQATVHNLQSAYDTYIRNTMLEAGDERLPRLRGHATGALHCLEAVTALAHFVERHEGSRTDDAEEAIMSLVARDEVRSVTLNDLLYWANAFMQKGRALAEDLLPSYTNVQELEVEISDDMILHARPASLIVGIVTRYGTPVEMEIQGEACNAGSMLSLMVVIGSYPKEKRFLFRGDEKPLRDIRLLFEAGLGEDGMDDLPDELDYLRPS